MKHTLFRFCLIFLITVTLASCSNESESVSFDDVAYFPIKEGATWVYQVDSIWVDCLSDRFDTLQFQVKEVMESWVLGANGDSLMRIARFQRADSTMNWGPPRIWTARTTNREAIKTEENRALVKLVFPIQDGLSWDGHVYLTDSPSEWVYAETEAPYDSLSRTVLVVQEDAENLLEKRSFSERYAFGIGLVHVQKIDVIGIVTDPGDPNDCEAYLPPSVPWNALPILERIKFGYVYEMRLLSFDPGP